MKIRLEWSIVALIAMAAAFPACGVERADTDGASSSESSDEARSGSNEGLSANCGDDCDESHSFANDATGDAQDQEFSVSGDSLAQAQTAQMGRTPGFTLAPGKEAWYRVVVPARSIVRVGIEMDLSKGDLDLVAYDANGKLLGSRFGTVYPYAWRQHETNTEYYGFYSENGNTAYYVRVVGHNGVGNSYALNVDSFHYADGETCTGEGFSFSDCSGEGSNGSGLIPFPFPDPADKVLGDGYDFASFTNYRFARRELVMLVRHALAETRRAFPGTSKLSLIDICQMDGVTPGYDIDDPRHPASTHDQGGNIDISYFQTDGSNNAEIVCGDGSDHGDGYCSPGAVKTHKVDLPRQAFFMAQLFRSERTRVVGVDRVLAPLLLNAAKELAALPAKDPRRIDSNDVAAFSSQMAYGDGWPYHHHHIHLSMQWRTNSALAQGSTSTFSAPFPTLMQAPGADVRTLEMTWPPRP